MNYQRLTLVGNATGDAQRRTSKKGDVEYTTFSVGVSDAKKRTTYFPVTAFGALGKLAGKHITKGRQVLVDGRVEVSDNNRFNVVADDIQLGAQGVVRHGDGHNKSDGRADCTRAEETPARAKVT
jgi:single-stranded DNA-binding protein